MTGNTEVLIILLFWGTWLMIPVVTDGVATLWYIWVSLWVLTRPAPPPLDARLPKVSVIIPAYNEQHNIGYCLMSLKAQTYPHHLIEIIVVDDGSSDRTCDAVLNHIGKHSIFQSYLHTSSFTVGASSFSGVINLIRRKRGEGTKHGKPAAVNAGLAVATGDIIVALDSDVTLEPTAIEQAVQAFSADEKLLAATGHLIIDSYLIVETDAKGQVRVDDLGVPLAKQLSPNEAMLAACQFIEYATAFHLGRRSESWIDSMFTMSGACAVFRREAFDITKGYRGRTVSEDTDTTMMLHSVPDKHIGYLPQVRVHLAPVLSWSALYSQRLRWRRGALEVSAIHLSSHSPARRKRLFWKVMLPLRLQVNHTLTLPRLMWTFFIFLLPMIGYSWSLISQAFGLLFVFYLCVDSLRILLAYVFSSPPEKVFIRKYLGYVALLPLYNMFLFWTHLSANICTVTQEATWTVSNPMLKKLETIDMRSVVAHLALTFRNYM
jgi:cellulose synthase/poly-beta-1,6-N-acetylglucosamine synthase-like glycosyltransferase